MSMYLYELFKVETETWRAREMNDSAFESIGCSSRGLTFGAQHPQQIAYNYL